MRPWRRIRRLLPLVALLALFALLGAACGQDTTGTSTASADHSLVDIGQGLQGPAGTSASVYAAGLPHVSALAFDPSGRLWAATAAYQDEGADGLYLVSAPDTTPVEVVSGLHTPLGLLWIDDTLYVSSSGRVEAYHDFDGTAFASRQTIVSFPDGGGEVNGLALGPDGRIALGISAPCDACVPDSELSGAVVSFLPDGTDVRVDARNIRAPVGLTYRPGTGDLYVTMNQRDDLGDATPGDWLSIVRPGQDWKFPDCYGQGGEVCAGVPSPVAVLDAHAAVSGVTIVDGQLGPSGGDAALVAEWADGKVLAVSLDDGSASGTVWPIVTGLQNPVPVVTAPDGAVLVGDWGPGTVYRIAT